MFNLEVRFSSDNLAAELEQEMMAQIKQSAERALGPMKCKVHSKAIELAEITKTSRGFEVKCDTCCDEFKVEAERALSRALA